MNKKLMLIVSSVAVAGALLLAVPAVLAQQTTPPAAPAPAVPHVERHPAIRRAIRALEAAKNDMQHADHDFGGHRVEALAACDAAIAQLQQALQYDQQ
jgi:hypothetical protein